MPLLERVRFCAIYASNLDEFFMVRVAGLFDQLDAGIDARGPDGLAAGEQIDAIQPRVLELDTRLHSCFNGILRPALEEHGVRIVSLETASEERAARNRRPLPRAGLPGADPARGRPRPSLPLHLQPLAQPRRAAARPRQRHRDHRPRQGAEGAARPLPAGRRAQRGLRAAGGGDRRQPRRALPRRRGRSTTATSASPATPTSRSPTRPTTCCRRSRTSCAAAASARSCGSRSRPG